MANRSPLRWMGGKSKIAKWIVSHFPERRICYVEPFCGACHVLFAKSALPKESEVINDKDGDLINLFRVFRYHPEYLQQEMAYLLHSREEFCHAREYLGVTDIQRAANFLMIIRNCFGGILRDTPSFGYAIVHRYHNGLPLFKIKNIITAFRERLDNVVIENLDFADVIRRYDSPDTLFYCDPPYIDTQQYRLQFTIDDHRRLVDCLSQIKGMALVSLNDCPEARELYDGWNGKTKDVRYSISRTKADSASLRRELLFLNNAATERLKENMQSILEEES
ncbi:MAG: DNA adenine methylase [Clostridiales bacterium]|nr:DNA adenine methylase [Clostridiales bacterium]